MSKIQTIIYLLVFIIVLFSMDMIFGNPLRETFRGGTGGGRLGGAGLGVKSSIGAGIGPRLNKIIGTGLPNAPLITSNIPLWVLKRQSDDEPLHFSFPF
jgi:hypothetical protein